MRGHKEIEIGALILQKLKENGRSIKWLAQKLECDDSNLGKVLKNSQFIYVDMLCLISLAIEEDLFACCSNELRKRLPLGNHPHGGR
ncbi:MAG: hypothetical protein LBC84_01620 [Prevotellaceae bacterium]|jgi:hypothetical protein|nr:hypothetical protein [Prevotellaceae bacterium]